MYSVGTRINYNDHLAEIVEVITEVAQGSPLCNPAYRIEIIENNTFRTNGNNWDPKRTTMVVWADQFKVVKGGQDA